MEEGLLELGAEGGELFLELGEGVGLLLERCGLFGHGGFEGGDSCFGFGGKGYGDVDFDGGGAGEARRGELLEVGGAG